MVWFLVFGFWFLVWFVLRFVRYNEQDLGSLLGLDR